MPSLPLLQKHDGKKFKETMLEDPTVDLQTEGGYRPTRPRYTRRPPREFTLGFTFITDSEKQALESFWFACRGGSAIIDGWRHPVSGETIPVRFKRGTKPEFTRIAAVGPANRWDVSGIVLEEV